MRVFHHLVYDGLPTWRRLDSHRHCCCGFSAPDRLHHFWSCPVAVTLMTDINRCLPFSLRPVLRHHLWLTQRPMRPAGPPTHLHSGVWRVVCLAAVVALNSSRKFIYARLQPRQTPQPDAGRARFPPVRRTNVTTAACAHAVTHFWNLLQDFCTAGDAPVCCRLAVPAGHPFLHWDPGATQWCLDRPP